MKEYIKTLRKRIRANNIFDWLIVSTVAVSIVLTPIITDSDNLPLGWEIPKVEMLQKLCIGICAIGILKGILSIKAIVKYPKFKSFTLLTAFLVLILLTSLLSPYKDISIHGNKFRQQGLISYFLMASAVFFLGTSINKKNIHTIFMAFIISGIIQSIWAMSQFNELKGTPEIIREGTKLFGSFGQTNFLVGRLLVSLILSGYYISHGHITLKALSLLSAVILSITITFTFSTWGWITGAVSLLVISLYLLLDRKAFSILVKVSYVGTALGIAYIIYNINKYNFRIDIWKSTLNIFRSDISNLSTAKRAFLGYGLDTQAEVYKNRNLFPGLIVDRAHNLFFDILIQTGLAGILYFFGLLFRLSYKLSKSLKDKQFAYVFISLNILIFRSLVHTSSIVNIFDLFILMAIALALTHSNKLRVNSHSKINNHN